MDEMVEDLKNREEIMRLKEVRRLSEQAKRVRPFEPHRQLHGIFESHYFALSRRRVA